MGLEMNKRMGLQSDIGLGWGVVRIRGKGVKLGLDEGLELGSELDKGWV